ncbi:MAG: thiamine pyrophosphate-binding protein [Chloroflexi bacterium]|nr:thiamine pyrophosphate-binding protein [Chloroflexota bacterium]
MSLEDGLRLVERLRQGAVVVTCEENTLPWAKVSRSKELDIPFPDAVGKGVSLGLGIALARPDKKVVVVDTDGALLANLGAMATVAGKEPANLVHFLVQDGIYAFRGGVPIPDIGKLSFASLARGAGYTSVYEFSDLEELALQVEEVMNAPGPVFVCLKVRPDPDMLLDFPDYDGGEGMRKAIATVRELLAQSAPGASEDGGRSQESGTDI